MTTPETLTVAAPANEASPTLASLDTLDRLLEVVERLTEDLAQHMPPLRRRKAFQGGCWVVGLSVGGGIDEPKRTQYTRLDVEIGLTDGGRHVRITTRKTVRDKDMWRQVHEAELDEAGWRTTEAFLQDEFLEFARLWFDAR